MAKSERPEDVAAGERAAAAFRAGNYQQSLSELDMIPYKGIRATRWEAWSHYRLQQIDAARAGFDRILREDPLDQDAHVGLAYCALSEKKRPEAAERFNLALSRDPDDVGGAVRACGWIQPGKHRNQTDARAVGSTFRRGGDELIAASSVPLHAPQSGEHFPPPSALFRSRRSIGRCDP